MYTKADLKALVPRKIFERGQAYYDAADAVGHITQKGPTYKAKVRGTETYRVELTVQPSGPPKIYCDCPYNYGDVCKHGIALGLAVLDLVGTTAPPLNPAPRVAPQAPTSQQLQKALPVALSRISDKEKIAYLAQLLYHKPDLIPAFLDAFEFSVPLLLAAPAARPRPQPVVRTFVQVAAEMLQTGHKPDLLPYLLRYDWRSVTAEDAHKLADLLAAAAHFQPETTLDAVMERIETYLAASQRSALIYQRLVSWLAALYTVPTIAEQVHLFASELGKQYNRRAELCGALIDAGFLPLATDVQEEAWRKKEANKAKAVAPLRRPGRPPRPRS